MIRPAHSPVRNLASCLLCLATSAFALSANCQASEAVSFRKEIAPILMDNCIACHGPKKAEGGYRVDTFSRVAAAGDSGLVAVTAGKLDESELYRRIISEDADERMPLDGEPLTAEQVELVKRWIAEGAKYDAEDPKAALATIIPPPVHPDPPEAYPHTMPVTAVAFSPDGQKLYVGGYHELTIWNPNSGELLGRVKNIGQRTLALAVDSAGKTLAVACGAPGRLGEIRLLDAESGALQKVLGTTSDVVLDVAFSPDGKLLASGAADGAIRIFDVASGEETRKITSHSDWVMAVAWSADGAKLASASRDKTSKVFDLKSGELLVTYAGHNQPVKGVCFHPDGAEVYSSGSDNKIHRWKVADGKKSADVGSFGNEVYKLPASGDSFFAASADKSVRQYELKTHKEVRKFDGHADWALSVAHAGSSKLVAAGGFDGVVKVWKAEDGTLVSSFVAAPGLANQK